MESHHHSSPSGSRRDLYFRKERRMFENSKSVGNRSIVSGRKTPDFKSGGVRNSRMPRKSSESGSRGQDEKKRKNVDTRYEKRRDHRSSFSEYRSESQDRSKRKIRHDSISSEGPRSEDENDRVNNSSSNFRYFDRNHDKRRTKRAKSNRKIKYPSGRRNDRMTKSYASANHNVDQQYNAASRNYSHEFDYPLQQMKSTNYHVNHKDSPMRYSAATITNSHRYEPKDRGNERDPHYDESRFSNKRRFINTFSISRRTRNEVRNRRSNRKRLKSPSTYKRSSSIDYRRTSSPSGGSTASSHSHCRSRKLTKKKEYKSRSSLRKSQEYHTKKHSSGHDHDEYVESIHFRERKMKGHQMQLKLNALKREREWRYSHEISTPKKPHGLSLEKKYEGNMDTNRNIRKTNYKHKRKRSRRSEKRKSDDKRYDHYDRYYDHASFRDPEMHSNIYHENQFSHSQDISSPRHASHYNEHVNKNDRHYGDRYLKYENHHSSRRSYGYHDDDDDDHESRHRSHYSKKRRDLNKPEYSRSRTRVQANEPYRRSKKSIHKTYVLQVKGKKKKRKEKKRRKYSSSHSSSRYHSSSYSRSVRSSRNRHSRSSTSTDRDVAIRRQRHIRSENDANSQQLYLNRDRRPHEGHSNAVVSEDDWDCSSESNGEDIENKREQKRQMTDEYEKKNSKAARSSSFENSNDENENIDNRENCAFDEDDDESSSVRDDTVGHFNGGPGTIINGRYKVVGDVGMGTFGRVVECTMLESGNRKVSASNDGLSTAAISNSLPFKKPSHKPKSRNVAIKIVRNVRRYYESALIEADILKDVNSRGGRGKSLCAKLLDRFTISGHYCLVFECLGMSLYDFLKAHDYTPFPIYCVRDFAHQLLDALEFLHSFQLIHTDLKPENILLVSNQETTYRTREGSKYIVPKSTKIKVIDFGGATYDNEKKSSIVNTRQYRAPEVILDLGWSTPSDLWSAGCIIAELYLGELLFATHDNIEHLALMQSVLGPFPRDILARSKSNLVREAFDSSGLHKRSRVLSPRKEMHVKRMTSLEELIHSNGLPSDGDSKGKTKTSFVKLLLSLLSIDQESRITALEALQSYFFRH